MKRLISSDDPSAYLISLHTTKEEKGRKQPQNQIYSREFQAMLDNLDREEECGIDEAVGPMSDKKRRLRSDQVKALEKNFEVENKLEPERKAQLAEELGLQPRQVAIWFQNRRARYKTKQLERDYSVLRANYDSLKLDYDNLEQEKAALAAELRELRLKLKLRQGLILDGHESPVSDSVNNASTSENIGTGAAAGSERSDEIKEEFPQNTNEVFVSSPSFYDPQPHSVPSWLQFSGPMRSVKTEEDEQQQQQGFVGAEEACNFFSVDHAPTLYWQFQ